LSVGLLFLNKLNSNIDDTTHSSQDTSPFFFNKLNAAFVIVSISESFISINLQEGSKVLLLLFFSISVSTDKDNLIMFHSKNKLSFHSLLRIEATKSSSLITHPLSANIFSASLLINLN